MTLRQHIHCNIYSIVGALLGVVGFITISLSAPIYIPVISGQFTTGQWYFDGEDSSMGGNASLMFIPALRFSKRFSVIPTVQSTYLGTRSAEELAGGNYLFQDTWENSANVKLVHQFGQNWRLKEDMGIRAKFFRETADEKMGTGLYDYRILNVGGEAEYTWNPKLSLALGYDFSTTDFPNYQSLESAQSDDMAREYAGQDVLNTTNHLATMRSNVPLGWGLSSQIQGYYSPRFYSDQTVVVESGLLSSTKRTDDFEGANLSVERIFKPSRKMYLLANVNYGYSLLNSNQNHYDATQTTFISNYYDYRQARIGTGLQMGLNLNRLGPTTFDMGVSYSHRQYSNRVIQDSQGTYLNEKLYQTESAITLGFSYPLARFFRLRVSSVFGENRSNNRYEELYRYNYKNANYQFGFTYDY